MLFTQDNKIDTDVLNEILKCFYLSTAISIAAYNNNYECLASHTNMIEEILEIISIDKHFDTINIELQKKSSVPEEFIFATDEFQLTYAVIGLWNNDALHGFIVAGPINYGNITKEKFEKKVQMSNLPVYIKPKLMHLFNNIPFKEIVSLRAICKLLLAMITSPINYFKILAIDTIHLEPVQIPPEEFIHPSEAYQEDYKDLVSKIVYYTKLGDKEMLQRLLNKKTNFTNFISKEFSHAFKDHKISVIWMMNLFAFPLLEAGIPAEKIMRMITYYLNAIADCQNETELTILADKMINDFLDESAFNLETDFPSPINKTMFYIHHHLHEELTLKQIAKVVHMSPKYFSRYFKEKTGMNFRDYVNKKRISKGKDLLNYSDANLDDIALAIGFQNQSYFTTVFKKYTGTTPNKYRHKE